MSNKTKISIVLGTYNRRSFLVKTIKSIRDNGIAVSYEIIVVDGGSTDGTIKWLSKQKDIISIIQHNRGVWRSSTIKRRSWGYFMNLGFKSAQGKYIVMISDDCLLVPGAVQNGYDLFEEKLMMGDKVGGMAFYWRNSIIQKEYWIGYFGNKMFINHGMYLRSAMENVGWAEEDLYSFYYADSDLCLKMWNSGYKVIDSPRSFVEHFPHANLRIRDSNSLTVQKDEQAFLKRWDGIFYDPSSENTGSWLKINFKDPVATVNKFPLIELIKYKIILFLNKIRNRLKLVYIAKYLKKILQ